MDKNEFKKRLEDMNRNRAKTIVSSAPQNNNNIKNTPEKNNISKPDTAAIVQPKKNANEEVTPEHSLFKKNLEQMLKNKNEIINQGGKQENDEQPQKKDRGYSIASEQLKSKIFKFENDDGNKQENEEHEQDKPEKVLKKSHQRVHMKRQEFLNSIEYSRYKQFFKDNFESTNTDTSNSKTNNNKDSIIDSFVIIENQKDTSKQSSKPQKDKQKIKQLTLEDVSAEGDIIKVKREIYLSKLTNSSEKIFSKMSHERIRKWFNILSKSESGLRDFSELKSIAQESVTNLIVIKKDVNRTRVREAQLFGNFFEYLECIIIYFCKVTNVKYKQGLNEVIAPFLLLYLKDPTLTLNEIFLMAQGFMNKFLTNFYHEIDFFSVKSTFRLVELLLKYHYPGIFDIFDKNEVRPEIYAMSWLLTYFSGKVDLDILYELWNEIIEINDSAFIMYVIVAFLAYNKNKYYSNDLSIILSSLNQIVFTSKEEVREVVNIAKELRSRTPYSFRVLTNKLEIFTPNSTRLKQKYDSIRPDLLLTIPIYPTEIIYFTYPNALSCPDEFCIEAKRKYKDYLCEHCTMKIEKYLNYIILDFRILEYGNFESLTENEGFLPNMITQNKEDLKSNYFDEKVTARFQDEKGNYHFIVLTTKTDYFTVYENNFYVETDPQSQNDPLSYTNPQKSEKELDTSKAKTASKKEKQKLKEYDNFKKLMSKFNLRDIPYLSIAYGGYTQIHKQCMYLEINLLNHDVECCRLCQLKKVKQDTGLMSKFKKLYKKELKEGYSDSDDVIKEEINEEVDDNNYDSLWDKELSDVEDIDVRKKLGLNDIAKIISNNKFNIYFCQLKMLKEIERNEETMILIKFNEICFFKFKINMNNFSVDDEVNKNIKVFYTIPINSISYILQNRVEKNILNITYNNTRKGKFLDFISGGVNGSINDVTPAGSGKDEVITLDFGNEANGKKFIFSVNHAKTVAIKNSEKKNEQ